MNTFAFFQMMKKKNQQQGAARPTFQPTERQDRELSLPKNDMVSASYLK